MVKKIINYKNFNILSKHRKSIILIGNFDGVHLGHQKLFKLARGYKKKLRSKIGVITFEPMPKMFFNQNIKNFRISTLKQKEILLMIEFILLKNSPKKQITIHLVIKIILFRVKVFLTN